MSDPDPRPRPKLDRARHALLFELFRQRNMAHYVAQNRTALPETLSADLRLFAQSASRSIAPDRPSQPLF
ncbi:MULTISPECIES: hypothetical protein [unclassified Roseovarius]|uniref:hypothetical protein n=1 Tax=unclassified Roseovarius TaxID=2614913 RepID=UPI0000685B3D|nr:MULTISPECIES: hypothetical protein [unclassified Roseovarius]EAQ26617.1 hypothetical protein ROS217_18862 [Roseovarius sp. 217]KJS45299.1 MAG: hypothetical protein VR71_02555 [Roseovarius sp. BRH_c41]